MSAPMPNEKSLSPEASLTDSAHRGVATTVDTGPGEQSTSFTIQQSSGPLLDQRYQLGAEIARGGMGVVHRAVDAIFKREVAVKLLLPKWERETDQQRQEERKSQILEAFRYEAEITARLQHPGIPPVHELGRLSDGLPFLAMKLIQGDTLQALLHKRTSLLAELPRWLQIFEQISQAVGYAHSQRILHRDLKPANIMVGEFGEVQVMDWGLAKVVGEAEPAGVDFDDDDAATDARQFVSRRGDIKGTLAYMPPEQARGEIDELDPRADVFALGAILCEILTGSPPYTGRTVSELKVQAAAGELAAVFHSLRLSGADPGIVELAIACLSPNATDRPFDGTAVAQAVAVHRASVEQRLRRAETERALSAQQLVEQGRRRKLWFGIAAALLLLTAVSSSLALVYARSNTIIADRELKAKNAATLATQREGEAKAAAELARQREGEANAAKATALDQEKIAKEQAATSAAVKEFLELTLSYAGAEEQLAAGLEVNPDLKVRDIVLRAVNLVEQKLGEQPAVEAEVRAILCRSLFRLGEFALAIKEGERSRELYQQLLGPNDVKTHLVTHLLAEAYMQAGKQDQGLALHRELLELSKKVVGPKDARTLAEMNTLANALRATGDLVGALKLYEEALELQMKALGPDDPETLATRHNLALAYRANGQLDRALPILEDTAKRIASKVGPDHPDSLGVLTNLALAYRAKGRADAAVPLFEQVLQGRQKSLGAEHPGTLEAMNNLAIALDGSGKSTEAAAMLREVLRLRKEKLGPDHPQTLEAMNNLVIAYQNTQQLKLALPLAEETLKLRRAKLGPEHPQTIGSMENLANTYNDMGESVLAIPLLEDVLTFRKKTFGAEHPKTLLTLQNLSKAYCDAKEFEKAAPLLEVTLKLSETQNGPEHFNTLVSLNNLATAYHATGKHAEAAKLHERVLEIATKKLGPRHPNTIGSMLNLAMVEISLKRYTDAEDHLQKVWEAVMRLPPAIKHDIQVAAAEQFIKLYEAWEKAEELAKWQAELKKLQP